MPALAHQPKLIIDASAERSGVTGTSRLSLVRSRPQPRTGPGDTDEDCETSMKKIEDSSGFDQVEMRNHREAERQKTKHYIDHHNRTLPPLSLH
jgi:hypothetical protein